jgi:hypothetical protein
MRTRTHTPGVAGRLSDCRAVVWCQRLPHCDPACLSESLSVPRTRPPLPSLGAESHPELALYFYVFVIVGAFFAVNLFVGVVIDQFGRMKQDYEGSALLTKQQAQWCVP